MEPLLIALVVLGCADDFADCTRVEGPELSYSTAAECEAEIDFALIDNSNLSNPGDHRPL